MSNQYRYQVHRAAEESNCFEPMMLRCRYGRRFPTFHFLLTCSVSLVTCIGVTACGADVFCLSRPGFYVEGELLGADACPLKNAIVQLDWGTERDAEQNRVPFTPWVVSTDENGRFDTVLSSSVRSVAAVDGIFCPSGTDYYEPTDLEMIELTIDAEDVVETIEVTIAEEMIVGSNSFSEIDIDLGVIMLQEISTCEEDATGDES